MLPVKAGSDEESAPSEFEAFVNSAAYIDYPHPPYDEIPLRALASMIDLQRTVRSELGEITTPVLVLEGGRDETVAPRAPSMLEAGLGSSRKTRIRFERSGRARRRRALLRRSLRRLKPG